MTHDEQLDNTPLPFGKYSGMTPDQISSKDPGYIVWMWREMNPKRTSAALYKDCQHEIDQERVARDQDTDEPGFR